MTAHTPGKQDVANLRDAVELLEGGDWQGAHLIVQDDESRLGCWAHGVVHMMEGDLDNADYWYRRAGRPRPDVSCIETELTALRHQAFG
jgi:hypothetical protein